MSEGSNRIGAGSWLLCVFGVGAALSAIGLSDTIAAAGGLVIGCAIAIAVTSWSP